MKRLFIIMLIGCTLLSGLAASAQQATPPQAGDPPVRALIAISPPDDNGLVTITGAAGAVFPAAQLAIRNLYTQDTVYAAAGITGSFSAQIFGPGVTPFLINAAEQIPAALRESTGSLPGGPGLIVYSAPPSTPPLAGALPITQLIVDGDLGDWAAYPEAQITEGLFALLNRDSLIIASAGDTPIGAQVAIQVTLNTTAYEIVLDPRLPESAVVTRLTPEPVEVGRLAVGAAVSEAGDVLEVRLPLTPYLASFTNFTFDQIALRTDGGDDIRTSAAAALLIQQEQQDGIVYAEPPLAENARRFTLAGTVARGAGVWTAEGRANALAFAPGDMLIVELDLTLNAPDFPAEQGGLRLIGEFSLQPVAIASDGGTVADQPIAALHTHNGWSNLRTPSGLALDNLRGDVPLGQVTLEPGQVIRRGDQLLAPMRLVAALPADLPAGVYVPVLKGQAQIADGPAFAWAENGPFGAGSGSPEALTRLPLVLNVGGITETRLLWTLFYDQPSDGSRGIMAEEDAGRAALSNRVRFNSPTYILPPGAYPLEPYLLNMLPNDYTATAAPLLPLLFPGGRMQAVVTTPNRFTQELPSAGIAQDRVSSQAVNERTVFGAQSPVDVYRLTTLNPGYGRFPFDNYGEYTIALNGGTEDIFGNSYTGGGTYRVVIAEPLDLSPGVLPGTPFEVGDALYGGLRLAPGVPAEVTMTVRVFPLDGSGVSERVFSGQANRAGYFAPGGDPLIFSVPGEYVIDYDARYEAPDGRLWAASLRSAGVIATPDSAVVARGRRGLLGADDSTAQAWFNTAVLAPQGDTAFVHSPYFNGDIAYTTEGSDSGVAPALQVQDLGGTYAAWLAGSLPAGREPAEQAANRGQLPLEPVLGGPPGVYSAALRPDFIANDAYAYLNAVRPGITLRQLVLGSSGAGLPLNWDGDDVFNQQIGAGSSGDRPGDYAFLFGGAIIRNAEAGVQTAAIYAAVAVVGGEDVPASVVPPYNGAGGGAGRPLLTINNTPIDLFFHLSSLHPGQVLTLGDTLALAGQAAPALPSSVQMRVIAPSGTTAAFSGRTNAIGYYYDPANDFAVNETGVWTVELTVMPAGSSSAGVPQAPLPEGSLPGLLTRRFEVFVIAPDAPAVAWQDGGDVDRGITLTNPFNFTVTVPQGWTESTAYLTIATEAYTLQTGQFRLNGASATYTLQRAALNAITPTLEREGGVGPSGSDVLRLTFAITGLDENGQPSIRTRTFYVFHDRLISLEGGEGA